MNYDIYLVGVGGQGILTIGEILADTALRKGMPVSFYPSKGMAQRGGFVKAQLRFNRSAVGPNIPVKGADLVVAMEQSEALKAVRFARPGGDFVLFGEVWAPTAVMLGKAGYPGRDEVVEAVKASGAKLTYINPEDVPEYEGRQVMPNVYILGVTLRNTSLGQIFTAEEVEQSIVERWQKASAGNRFAFQSGLGAVIA